MSGSNNPLSNKVSAAIQDNAFDSSNDNKHRQGGNNFRQGRPGIANRKHGTTSSSSFIDTAAVQSSQEEEASMIRSKPKGILKRETNRAGRGSVESSWWKIENEDPFKVKAFQ